MTQDNRGFGQVAQILPQRLRWRALALPMEEQNRAEELRLRVGQPMSVVLPEGEVFFEDAPVTGEELERLLELASQSSVHAVMEQVRSGYLTLAGGHRVGLCGTAVVKEGELYTLRNLSSVGIRIARQRPGAAHGVLAKLTEEGRLASTLILAPPGLGKTTLLRDIIRAVSYGEGISPQRVGLADERGEVAALWQGQPQLDVGSRTDVMAGCAKARGLLLLLRAMNPQVLAVDEITASEDVQALIQAAGCGTTLLATAHGGGRDDLFRRPVYRALMEARVFQKLVIIRREGDVRHYHVEELYGEADWCAAGGGRDDGDWGASRRTAGQAGADFGADYGRAGAAGAGADPASHPHAAAFSENCPAVGGGDSPTF